MAKIFNSTTALIIGIILFLIGAYQGGQYDIAQESGFKVNAKIVEVVEKEEHDADLTYSYDTYTVYADYVINGKEYSHVKVGKYTEPKFVGDTIEVVVNPNKPSSLMSEGGAIAVLGTVLIAGSVVAKVRNKKQTSAKNNEA